MSAHDVRLSPVTHRLQLAGAQFEQRDAMAVANKNRCTRSQLELLI